MEKNGNRLLDNYEKFLPIGTVVMLKNGEKKVMITGFCSIADNNKSKVFDYVGCLYPEGILSSNQNCLFDHEQIEKIYFLGFSNEEDKIFKEKLFQIIKNNNLTN